MGFPPVVRRAILDRAHPRRRFMKAGSASVEVVVRLEVGPRVRSIGGREHQIRLSAREMSCLQPCQTTLFGSLNDRRTVKLIINRRRAELLSITSTGILVFLFRKSSQKKEGGLL